MKPILTDAATRKMNEVPRDRNFTTKIALTRRNELSRKQKIHELPPSSFVVHAKSTANSAAIGNTRQPTILLEKSFEILTSALSASKHVPNRKATTRNAFAAEAAIISVGKPSAV